MSFPTRWPLRKISYEPSAVTNSVARSTGLLTVKPFRRSDAGPPSCATEGCPHGWIPMGPSTSAVFQFSISFVEVLHASGASDQDFHPFSGTSDEVFQPEPPV